MCTDVLHFVLAHGSRGLQHLDWEVHGLVSILPLWGPSLRLSRWPPKAPLAFRQGWS